MNRCRAYWMAAAMLAVLCVCGGEADDAGAIQYQDIRSAEQAPPRLQRALHHHWKGLPEGTTVRIGIGQVFDFGHGESSNQLEPALRSFVPLDAAGRPHGEERLIAASGRGEGREVTAIVPWRNGVKHGVEKQFESENGRRFVAVELPWKNGQVDGMRRTYHPDGRLRSETTCRRGVPDGPARTFDAEGALLRESAMKNGRRHGEMKDYWPGTTQVRKVIPYRDGLVEGLVREYYKDGRIKRETEFCNDRMHGEDHHYAADGERVRTVRWKDGDELPAAP